MIHDQIIYDCFSASLDSKPFKAIKIKVDLDFLESRAFVTRRLTSARTVFDLGNTFWVDPCGVPYHHNMIIKAVSKRRSNFLVKFLENHTGIFTRESGIARIGFHVKVISQLDPLNTNFELT